MNIGKALLSTQDLSHCGWVTVFPAGCVLRQESVGHSHHAREETMCLVHESQAQDSTTSCRALKVKSCWSDVDGPESRCVACG